MELLLPQQVWLRAITVSVTLLAEEYASEVAKWLLVRLVVLGRSGLQRLF